MTAPMFSNRPSDDRLVEALAAYLEQADNGDDATVLDAYPELATAIGEALGLGARLSVEAPAPSAAAMTLARRALRAELRRLRSGLTKQGGGGPRFLAVVGAIGIGLGVAGAFASGSVPAQPLAGALHSVEAVVNDYASTDQAAADTGPSLSVREATGWDVTEPASRVLDNLGSSQPALMQDSVMTSSTPVAPNADAEDKGTGKAPSVPESHRGSSGPAPSLSASSDNKSMPGTNTSRSSNNERDSGHGVGGPAGSIDTSGSTGSGPTGGVTSPNQIEENRDNGMSHGNNGNGQGNNGNGQGNNDEGNGLRANGPGSSESATGYTGDNRGHVGSPAGPTENNVSSQGNTSAEANQDGNAQGKISGSGEGQTGGGDLSDQSDRNTGVQGHSDDALGQTETALTIVEHGMARAATAATAMGTSEPAQAGRPANDSSALQLPD